jgi:hypothetical protein
MKLNVLSKLSRHRHTAISLEDYELLERTLSVRPSLLNEPLEKLGCQLNCKPLDWECPPVYVYFADDEEKEELKYNIAVMPNPSPKIIEWTPFHFAVALGRPASVLYLLWKGADLSIQDCLGNTAQKIVEDKLCDIKERQEILRMLHDYQQSDSIIANFKEKFIKDKKFTKQPTFRTLDSRSVYFGCYQTIDKTDLGGNMFTFEDLDTDSETWGHYAVNYDECEDLENPPAYMKWTLLQHAAATDNHTLCRSLLYKGANPSIRDLYGRSAENIAKYLRRENAMKVFQEFKSINAIPRIQLDIDIDSSSERFEILTDNSDHESDQYPDQESDLDRSPLIIDEIKTTHPRSDDNPTKKKKTE